MANEEALEEVADLIADLDVDVDPASRSSNTCIYLEHAKAEDVSQDSLNLSNSTACPLRLSWSCKRRRFRPLLRRKEQ